MKLNYNGLYYFRYLAKGEKNGSLSVYDKTPLVFILDIGIKHMLCINMHWIPKIHRLDFFDEVRSIMNKTHMVHNKKERMRLTYQLIKKPKFKIAINSIRMYYLDGITKLKEIPEKQWDVVIGISQYRMRKVYKKDNYKD